MEGGDDIKKASEVLSAELTKISSVGESHGVDVKSRHYFRLKRPSSEAELHELISKINLRVKYTAAVWRRKIELFNEDAWIDSEVQEKLDALNLDYSSFVRNASIEISLDVDVWVIQVDYEMFEPE